MKQKRDRKETEKMNKTDRKGKLQGSMTVEAALLMTIMLPVLVALIYAGFLIHDRGVMQGISCEVAAMGSNLAEYDDREERLSQTKDDLKDRRFLGTAGVASSMQYGKDGISVSYEGSFRIPGLISAFLGGTSREISGSCSREFFHPAEQIRKIRGVHYLLNLPGQSSSG